MFEENQTVTGILACFILEWIFIQSGFARKKLQGEFLLGSLFSRLIQENKPIQLWLEGTPYTGMINDGICFCLYAKKIRLSEYGWVNLNHMPEIKTNDQSKYNGENAPGKITWLTLNCKFLHSYFEKHSYDMYSLFTWDDYLIGGFSVIKK